MHMFADLELETKTDLCYIRMMFLQPTVVRRCTHVRLGKFSAGVVMSHQQARQGANWNFMAQHALCLIGPMCMFSCMAPGLWLSMG